MSIDPAYFGVSGFIFPVSSPSSACDYPDESDVREGIVYGDGLLVGELSGFVGEIDMPNFEEYSAADMARALVILGGLGFEPSDSLPDWTATVSVEPDKPERSITFYDTQSQDDGRVMYSGKVIKHYGVMARIRSKTYPEGWLKATQVMRYLSQNVRQSQISLGGKTYTIEACSKFTGPFSVGKDEGHTTLRVFTVNFLVSYKLEA